jgi:phosphoribosyl 1,2-cyclic phosphodiesterase
MPGLEDVMPMERRPASTPASGASGPSPGVTPLPRGGLLLDSAIGPIQYGAVPETIKDTMGTPAGVPTIFVVPPRLFSPERGINLAELEFPAYWNHYLKGRKTTIVCRPQQRDLIARVLSEAAFGPAAPDPREFSGSLPAGAPDLRRELAYFRATGPTAKRLELSDIVEFVEFGPDGKAPLPGGVQLALDDHGDLAVLESGRVRARAPGGLTLPPVPERAVGSRRSFVPPVFGVTVVGSGHGFDPGNRTSGFIVWLGGRGIMVDPPVDVVQWLAEYDLDPRQIDTLILTHCHADHDAGTLQKLLQEGRVTIYTTHTVLASFVAKYSLLTGMDPGRFCRLFDHVPVQAGEPVTIHGATAVFRYSLHSIPCIGFELTLRGKGMVYASDTLNDPDRIRELRDLGVLSQERARDLVDFPWHHELVLHEAGIPPIHTPIRVLAGLEDSIKKRLLLVHVSSKSLPADSGLTIAPTGLENTVDLAVPHLAVEGALEVLDAMARVDILADLPAARAAEFLRTVRKEKFAAGERVVAQGTPGDRFYVILVGHASVQQGGRELKVYHDFDYFGETALVTGSPRVADVFAKTDLVVLTVPRREFLYLLRGTDLPHRLEHLARLRELPSWELMCRSPLFRSLTSNQKNQLQALMRPVDLPAGTAIGPDPVIVESGTVTADMRGEALPDIGAGGLAGDARLRARKSPLAFRCATRVTGYLLPVREMRTFYRKNPGVYVLLTSSQDAQEPQAQG